MGSCCSTSRAARPRPTSLATRRPVGPVSADPVQQFLQLRAVLRSEFRRHHDDSDDSDGSSVDSSTDDPDSALDALVVLLVLLQQQPGPSTPLTDMSDIERVTKTEVVSAAWVSEQHDAACTICLCDVEAGSFVRHLPCGHTFHQKCVDAWLTSQQWTVCPNCRRDPRVSPGQPSADDDDEVREHHGAQNLAP